MEDKFKSMDIHNTKKGDLVTVTEQGMINGDKHDQCQAKNFLKVGSIYTVDEIAVHSYHTKVWLEEFPGVAFNSVQFVNYNHRPKSQYPLTPEETYPPFPKPMFSVIHLTDAYIYFKQRAEDKSADAFYTYLHQLEDGIPLSQQKIQP